MKFAVRNLLFLLFCSTVIAAAAPRTTKQQLLRVWPGNASLNIPMVDKAPAIDGFFRAGEWDKAAQFSGFSLLSGSAVTTGTGSMRLMRDRNNLYIAMRTTTPNNDPGGSLVSNAIVRDGKVFQDDSLDFMLVSDRSNETLYHFIINARNTVYDALHKGSNSNVAWNFQKLRCASHVDKGFWDMEIALPLDEIGSPRRSLKINVGRNWSNAGTSLLNPGAKYFDRKRMLTVRWNKHWGILRQLDAGDIGGGEWTLAASADNPSAKELCLALMLRHNTYKKVKGKSVKTQHIDVLKEIRIPAKRSGSIKTEFSAPGTARYHYTAVLFDPASGHIHGARNFAGTRGSTERHPSSCTFIIKDQGSGVVRYYPGYDKAVLQFRPAGKAGKFAVVLPDGKKAAGVFKNRCFNVRFPVPSAGGKYHFALEIDGKIFRKAFALEKRIFPWLGSGLGKDKIVLPPFKPLKADKGNIALALSRITLNSTGAWERFEAENIPMLSAPMKFKAVINGRSEYFPAAAADDPQSENNGYALRHRVRSRTASGVELAGCVRTEYDGFQYFDLELSGAKDTKIEKLTLQIPLRDSEVPYFHAVSNFIRENPSGRIPAGSGVVWNGSQLARRKALGQETLHPQAVPYIWLGGVSRGISLFAETTFGYALSRHTPAVRLIRRGGVMMLEWDFINKPITLKRSRKFAFGMMPTPVKKADPAMRRYTHDSSGIGAKNMKNFTFIGGQLMGFSPWRHDPFAGDFEVFRAACRAVRAGGKDNMAAELDSWLKKYENQLIKEMKQVPNAGDYPMHYSRVRKNFRRFQLDNPQRRPALPYKYTDPKLTWIFEDIPEYFRAEWFNPAPQGYFGARRISLIPSSIDYMVDALEKELANGAHGIYLDDMYLMPDTNPETVAKIDEDGVLHPSNGILGMRELVKRISVLQYKRKLFPRLLQIHMTNALLIPCFSLATSTLGWEKNYGDSPMPTRFTVDDILATGTGLHLGVENCVLGGIKRRTLSPKEFKQKYRWLTRTLIALSLPFDAKFKAPVTPAGDARFYFSIISIAGEFGYWKPECRFVPFWEKDAADITVNDKNVLASSWRFPGRVLLVLGNLSGKEKILNLKVNAGKLALKPGYKIVNTESRKAENPQKTVLPAYDFKLLILK